MGLQKNILGVLSLFLIFFILLGSAVQSKVAGKVYFNGRNDDLYSKKSLTELTKSNKSISIVVRDLISSSVRTISGTNPSSNLIAKLESTFTKNNFTVRDRALFEKSLNSSGTTDYSKIKELTNTDLILEVVGISNYPYVTNQYKSKNGQDKVARNQLSYNGTKLELRIIKIKDNDIVGTYTFYNTPCVNGCDVYKWGGMINTYAIGTTNPAMSYFVDESTWEVFTEAVAMKLINSIRE